MIKYQINLISHYFLVNFFMIKNWFRTKKYSCKFSQKSIVKKVQIGSTVIFLIEMKIIHIWNFLTINYYENLQKYFFVQKQLLIIKKGKKAKILNIEFSIGRRRPSWKKHVFLGGIAWVFSMVISRTLRVPNQ